MKISGKHDADRDADHAPERAGAAEPPRAAEDPIAEYPKMLYVGARRQQVTVNTAEEEAQWLASSKEPVAAPEPEPDTDKPRGKR